MRTCSQLCASFFRHLCQPPCGKCKASTCYGPLIVWVSGWSNLQCRPWSQERHTFLDNSRLLSAHFDRHRISRVVYKVGMVESALPFETRQAPISASRWMPRGISDANGERQGSGRLDGPANLFRNARIFRCACYRAFEAHQGYTKGAQAWGQRAALSPLGSHSLPIASRMRSARARGSSFCKIGARLKPQAPVQGTRRQT